ncbi:MAG: hypothetical protein J2P39_02095 [Candidatus Dormibacteraeota bacterium]|nr:hypothetical protein [Candidatus Dormibacteraeota bacterium]
MSEDDRAKEAAEAEEREESARTLEDLAEFDEGIPHAKELSTDEKALGDLMEIEGEYLRHRAGQDQERGDQKGDDVAPGPPSVER